MVAIARHRLDKTAIHTWLLILMLPLEVESDGCPAELKSTKFVVKKD
jgi:hypothetical protein